MPMLLLSQQPAGGISTATGTSVCPMPIMVLKVISGADYIPCDEPTLAEIDPDGNGRIDLSDAVYLLQTISGNRY